MADNCPLPAGSFLYLTYCDLIRFCSTSNSRIIVAAYACSLRPHDRNENFRLMNEIRAEAVGNTKNFRR